jgi:hypothetical protein
MDRRADSVIIYERLDYVEQISYSPVAIRIFLFSIEICGNGKLFRAASLSMMAGAASLCCTTT